MQLIHFQDCFGDQLPYMAVRRPWIHQSKILDVIQEDLPKIQHFGLDSGHVSDDFAQKKSRLSFTSQKYLHLGRKWQKILVQSTCYRLHRVHLHNPEVHGHSNFPN